MLDFESVSIEEGRIGEAQSTLTKVANEIHGQKNSDREAYARAILAHALLAQGDIAGAKKQVALAKTLTAKSQHRGIGVQIDILAAKVLEQRRRNNYLSATARFTPRTVQPND